MNEPLRSFKKSDLKRAIQASTELGLEVRQAEISPDGTIRLTYGSEQPGRKNDWDEVYEKDDWDRAIENAPTSKR